MSFSENKNNSHTALQVSEEVALAYLRPSYQTATSRNIRAEEETAMLLHLIEKDMDVTTLNIILQRQKEELSLLEETVKKQEEEIKEQMLMLAQIDKEKLQLIERLAQGIKEIAAIREKIDALLEKITASVNKIDTQIAILEKRNQNHYKSLQELVKKDFQKIPEQGVEQLKLDESGAKMEVNLNHIIDNIQTKLLKKIERQDTDLSVDNNRIVDKYLVKQFQKHTNSSNPSDFYDFTQLNLDSISSLKNKIDTIGAKIPSHNEIEFLLAEIIKNNGNLSQLREKREMLTELGDYLVTKKDKYSHFEENMKRITENKDKLSLANIDENTLTTLVSNLSGIKEVSKKLDQGPSYIAKIDSYIAGLTQSASTSSIELKTNRPSYSSYGKMMPVFKPDIEKPKTEMQPLTTGQQEKTQLASTYLNKNQDKKEEKQEIEIPSPSRRR